MGDAFDVAILGGGMAGNLLARQLRRAAPDARVLLLEKSTQRTAKVGESTVEICGKYLTKRLGLSSYLYDAHLPKNGLRFFFDRADRSGELEALSELGPSRFPPLPSFQIDRARFEADLLAMNRAEGVDVREGVRAASHERDGGAHVIGLEREGRAAGAVRARWLVDATGRSRWLARKEGLVEDAPEVRRAAVWGRFEGLVDIDAHGSEDFRARVHHTARRLSTTHFCYPGYWIWLIPLGADVTSVGVVMDEARFDARLRTREGFVAFLHEHRALATLLEPAALIEHRALPQLAHGTRRAIDADARWAMIGEAAAFTDPLYSPGADFIALLGDQITDLVRRDLAGEDVRARGALFERFFQLRHRATLRLHRDQYELLGSFSLFARKWDFDMACYLHLWVEPYLLDAHLDLSEVKREVEGGSRVLGLLDTMRHELVAGARALRAQDRFFARNLGELRLDPEMRWLEGALGDRDAFRRRMPRVRDMIGVVLDELDDAIGRPRATARVPFSTLTLGRPLPR